MNFDDEPTISVDMADALRRLQDALDKRAQSSPSPRNKQLGLACTVLVNTAIRCRDLQTCYPCKYP